MAHGAEIKTRVGVRILVWAQFDMNGKGEGVVTLPDDRGIYGADNKYFVRKTSKATSWRSE